MAGGCGGCPPTKPKEGASCPPSNPPRVGPNTLANPKPTGGAKGGPGGLPPGGGGCGGCPPTKPKEGASCPLWQPRHEWDPEPWQTQGPRGWENGVQGDAALWQGDWRDALPQNFRKGVSCVPTSLTKPPTAWHFLEKAISGKIVAQKPSWRGKYEVGVTNAQARNRNRF
jgi:hypothetical protein